MPIAPGDNPALPWRKFYEAVDAMDFDAWRAFLHPDASMRVGNYPVISGQENLEQLVSGVWTSWKLLKHNFENVWEEGDTTIVEAMVDHILADDTEVTTPCVTIIQWKDGKLLRHRAFEDLRPLEQ
jgi:ketosteroid isomerase-like protein